MKTAPFSKWAPLAQFYAGQALEKQRRWDEAIAAYEEVISRYPTDPTAADAQYQIGYVYLVQSRTAYDKSAATKSQDAFEDFLARYPTSEKAPQAQDNLKALQIKENSNAVEIAKYYDKKKNYKAAVIYYNEVIKEQPGSPEAKAAEARIDAVEGEGGRCRPRAGPGASRNRREGRRSSGGCRPRLRPLRAPITSDPRWPSRHRPPRRRSRRRQNPPCEPRRRSRPPAARGRARPAVAIANETSTPAGLPWRPSSACC